METNIASAQQLLRETGDEGDSTFDGASSHAKAALDEARQGLATGVAGVATAAAGAMTGGLANQSAAALQPKLDTNGAASANENGSLETAGQAERMQLVDEDQKFNSDVGKYLEKWHLADAGFAYDLCAVVGSQSTGKSTLLNKLFGTSFDVMNESQRRQTTKGIWMCRGVSMPVLVMDVEGSDGRERGEDQDFERKSALFSMASAECLLVNMWEHQVGLYQGANMGLLKTVFEVNLGLFQASKAKNHSGKDKTLIFFVIRDHIGATPLENLRATLMADLYRIWDSLSKPEGLETSRIEDFFDFDFTTLPHKLLQPQEFDKQVLQLRTRFTDRNSKGFIFKPEYHKRIPADGLPRYLETIWEQVVTNKDLDLPTQQELLAQFRCDEIASVAFGAFATEIKAFRKPIEAGSVLEALGADMGTHRSMALAKFDKEASRYHADVYKKKRVELLEKLNAALSPFFLGQLKNLHKAILASFKKSVLGRLKGDNYDFAEVVEGEKSKAELTFRAASTAICLADTDWTIDEELAQFNEDVTQIADQCRAEETKKMVTQIERTLKKEISEPVELALARPGTDMWDKVLRSFSESMEKAESSYLKKAKSFNCTKEENNVALSSLRRRAWLALRAKVDEQTADTVLMSKLRSVFEDRFRYDDEGVPRVWKPDDDIDGIFRQARDETVALVPIYAKIEPTDRNLAVSLPSTSEDPAHAAMVERGEDEEFDFPSTLNLFSETRKVEVANRFRKEADAYYVEAKRSMVSSIAQVPVWIYGVMVALGWNEFMAVVRSPLYFTFLVLCLAGAYVVWKLNMSGPILSVSKAVGREVHRLADEQLRNHFSQPLPQPAMLRETAAPSTKPAAKREEAPVEEFELKEKKPDLS